MWLLPFVLNLVITGWVIGVLTTSLIMRFGQEAEILAWSMVFLFQPISCVFYPIEVLPGWLQAIAWMNPAAHVFEGMRAVLNGPLSSRCPSWPGPARLNRLFLGRRDCCFIGRSRYCKNPGICWCALGSEPIAEDRGTSFGCIFTTAMIGLS